MKNFLKTFIHQPKKVIAFSLTIAILIGIIGFININKKIEIKPIQSEILSGDLSSPDITLGFLAGGRIKTVSVKAGDKVKKGEMLATLDAENAIGALAQARAAYNTAQANYQKIMNGATGTSVDVARAAVNTTEVNLEEITKQQDTLVENASRTLLNSSLQAQGASDYNGSDAPTVSGAYVCKKEGSYNLKTYGSTSGVSVNYSGLETGTLSLSDIPRPLGNCGLFLSLEKTKNFFPGLEFNIQIPNVNAANYNTNNNAYRLALQAKEQAIAGAQAVLDQAKASLSGVVANARPEDVASAQAQVENASGALQIAEAAYNNTVILAPGDGTIKAVYITEGQIATPNSPAIQFLGL